MTESNEKQEKKPAGKKLSAKAKKDHVICHNEHLFRIKKGDELGHIPELFHENLKTEGVI